MEEEVKNENSLKILRAIFRRPPNYDALTVNEIVKNVEGEKSTIYRHIKALVPQSREIWNKEYLFCFQDLFNILDKYDPKVIRLADKLRIYYNYFLQWDWKKVTCRIMDNCDNNKKIIRFEIDQDDYLTINLDKSAKRNLDKASIMIDKKFNVNNKNDGRFAKLYRMGKNRIIITDVPLKYYHKDSKLYFKTLLSKSRFKVKGESDILRFMPSKRGLRNMDSSYENKIRHVCINTKYSSEKKKRKIDKLLQKYDIEFLKFCGSTRNYTLNPTTKSLLLYVLQENDYVRLSKSIEYLSNSISDIIHENIRVKEFNEFEEEDNGVEHPFTIKRDFPYLSGYTLAKRHLAVDFIPRLLKRIALELNDKLRDMNGEEINYEVTKRFVEVIGTDILDNNNISRDSQKHIETYLKEIGNYLRYSDLKKIEGNKLEENWKNIYIKEENLRETLTRIIEHGIRRDKEVIPIYEQMQQAKVLWDSERHILEFIETKYGNKFLITKTCLVRKFKARKLRTLLRKKPTIEDANSLLKDGGIPEVCLYEFLTRLGFCIDITRQHQVTEIKKYKPARKWKLFDYLPPLIPLKKN